MAASIWSSPMPSEWASPASLTRQAAVSPRSWATIAPACWRNAASKAGSSVVGEEAMNSYVRSGELLLQLREFPLPRCGLYLGEEQLELLPDFLGCRLI